LKLLQKKNANVGASVENAEVVITTNYSNIGARVVQNVVNIRDRARVVHHPLLQTQKKFKPTFL